MSLRYWRFSEKALLSILFCSLTFGENNSPANVPSEHQLSSSIQHDITLVPQQTFDSITDSNTTLIGRWAYGPGSAADVSGNIAYFGNGGYLEVVDISNPANPNELGKVLTPSLVCDVAVSGSYAYVANSAGGLRIIDVSTPSSPVEVGFYDTGGYAGSSVAVSGSYAYVADWSNGLHIIDVSTPSSPVEVGFYDMGGDVYSVAVSGIYAYVAVGCDLRIIDVSTPSSPVEVGFYNTDAYAFGVAVSGSYAYVGNWALMVYASLMCPRLPVP